MYKMLHQKAAINRLYRKEKREQEACHRSKHNVK